MVYKLVFFVPKSHLKIVKQAVFKTGAGNYGSYANCCWQTLGTGSFIPLAGSKPCIGKVNQVTNVDEYRVETICTQKHLADAVAALKLSHPYECPVFDIYTMLDYADI